MPLNYKTWNAAERQYQKQGMSPKEIKRYRKAWENKHKKLSPKMLGSGTARSAADKAVSRKSKLEKLAADLEGKEF